jgi:hypothetical protein
MPTGTEAKLTHALERLRRLHQERSGSRALAASLDRIAHWQACRLDATYADLARNPRYVKAVAFFQSDLYGPGDFSQRDADMARVTPVLVRMLPPGAIATVAMAMELTALTQELDRRLIERLDAAAPLTVAAYCAAYESCGNRADREQQIALIVATGRALDRYVRKPLIRSTLAMMRRPARVAGLGSLQAFLERGFNAFASMHGADAFLATIQTRESALMEAVFAGDRAPFPDPLA